MHLVSQSLTLGFSGVAAATFATSRGLFRTGTTAYGDGRSYSPAVASTTWTSTAATEYAAAAGCRYGFAAADNKDVVAAGIAYERLARAQSNMFNNG